MSDVTIRDILEANPYGITRPGLLAWARLRIDPEFDEGRLAAELAALGSAVVEEGGFVTLAAPRMGVPGAARSEPPVPAPSPSADRYSADASPAPTGPPGGIAVAGPPWAASPGRGPADGSHAPAPARAAIEGWQAPGATPGSIDGWQAPTRAAPRRRLWGIAGLAFFALIALQAVSASFGSHPPASATLTPGETAAPAGTFLDASALSPGVCHQEPGAGTFYEVEVRDCSTPHDAEVYAVVQHPASSDAPYPGDDVIDRYVQTVCDPAFILYTRLDPQTQTELALAWYGPTQEGWTGGDRQVVCYFTSASGVPLTHSYRVDR